MSGYSGGLKLNFYRSRLKIDIEKGKIMTIGPYEAKDFFDGDVFFPDLTFLHLLFGHRDLDELRHIFVDCFPQSDESVLLVKILFPKSHTHAIAFA
jgi:hypothetical protein